jgi:hypothetical protein
VTSAEVFAVAFADGERRRAGARSVAAGGAGRSGRAGRRGLRLKAAVWVEFGVLPDNVTRAHPCFRKAIASEMIG